ncbi:MAG: nodulation protein NfeD, partial [bacterium]
MTKKIFRVLLPIVVSLILYPAAFSLISDRQDGKRSRVLVASFSGVISPVSAEFLSQSIDSANSGDFSAVILELDTPGGLDVSMREIIKKILASKVPVVTYVHPAGARAASAGVFITMASHVAAMSPGTNIGAAHPVMIGGLPIGGGKEEEKGGKTNAMEDKILNDASAYMRAIAQERKRNVEWAIKAVTKSDSISAEEALKLKVVDFIASDLDDLLAKMDGFDIPKSGKFRVKDAEIIRSNPTRRQRWLAAITDPNIAMILMSLG